GSMAGGVVARRADQAEGEIPGARGIQGLESGPYRRPRTFMNLGLVRRIVVEVLRLLQSVHVMLPVASHQNFVVYVRWFFPGNRQHILFTQLLQGHADPLRSLRMARVRISDAGFVGDDFHFGVATSCPSKIELICAGTVNP